MASTVDAAQSGHEHHKPNHDYHLVDPSPWPLVGSMSALALTAGGVLFMHDASGGGPIMILGLLGVFYTMYRWWSDVISESKHGDHTDVVAFGLRMGMLLFIVSEVMFFVAFFWAFFWGALVPPELVSVSWPPEGVEPVPTWSIPFLNTLILLLSGSTVTWAHHAIRENDQQTAFKALLLTVALGATFTGFQVYEYIHTIHQGFTLQDGIFGSTFYMATGFHGFHVIVGTTFLIVCTVRAYRMSFRPEKHVGFEAAAWYWHFVDAVWLFLFVCVYWYGGSLRFVTDGMG